MKSNKASSSETSFFMVSDRALGPGTELASYRSFAEMGNPFVPEAVNVSKGTMLVDISFKYF